MAGSVTFATAANGHVWIHTRSWLRAKQIGLLLMFRYGFRRQGRGIRATPDEAIYPAYIRGGLRVLAGWDICVGYDFLSDSDDTDRFVSRFVEKHIKSAAPHADA